MLVILLASHSSLRSQHIFPITPVIGYCSDDRMLCLSLDALLVFQCYKSPSFAELASLAKCSFNHTCRSLLLWIWNVWLVIGCYSCFRMLMLTCVAIEVCIYFNILVLIEIIALFQYLQNIEIIALFQYFEIYFKILN